MDLSFLSGKKSYIVAAVAVLVGLDQGLIQAGYSIPAIPQWVLVLLGAAGLYTLRNGITTDTAKAVSSVLANLPSPSTVVVTAPVSDLTCATIPKGIPVEVQNLPPIGKTT